MALAQTAGTLYSNTALAEVKQAVLGGPCLIFNVFCFNSDAASVTFVQFFDALSANVTVGATTPTFVIPLSPKSGVALSLNCPLGFKTGVTVACTATATGGGAPATAAVVAFSYVGG